MRRTSQLRQAARQFAGVVSTTTHSTPVAAASRPTLTFVSARTPRGQEHVCCRPSRVVSACNFTTTPTRPDGESLPKSLTTEQDLDYGTELVAQVDDTDYRPPPVVSQAESVEDVTDPTYVPATLADGLERVGGLDGWWDKSENYKTAFASFKPRRKILDPIALRLVLRRAVIEAFALRQSGLDAMLTSSWPVGGPQQLRRVSAVTVDSNGRLSGDMQAIIADLQSPETYGRAPLSVKSLLSRAEGVEDSAWESVPLPDDTIKFAVSKRFFQLSGQRIPDSDFGGVTNASSILSVVQQPPKAQTLVQEIEVRRPELLSIPNITFAAKRVTRGDKDKSVGRFKVIEEEFRKRDLPLKGHGFAERNKEMLRHSGGV